MNWKDIKYRLTLIVRDNDILREVSRNVAQNNNTIAFFVAIDIIYSLFRYGVVFTEYQAFNFFARTSQNRKTFVTVLWLVEQLKVYNPMEYRSCFHDKREFNTIFSDCLNRDWMAIDCQSTPPPPYQILKEFIHNHLRVVLKKSSGCSGKQVYVSTSEDTAEMLINKIENEGFDLIEESISNIEVIKNLNPTSLNTIRIVTVRSGEYFDVICACLRIGAVGSSVDNVSSGGSSARIDINTHKLDSLFCANDYRKTEGSQIGRNEIGLEIPYWNELIELVKKASLRVPQIHIVGWDVAITEKGPVLIEGNESFHTDVMQFYASPTEPGIKAKFKESITHIQ